MRGGKLAGGKGGDGKGLKISDRDAGGNKCKVEKGYEAKSELCMGEECDGGCMHLVFLISLCSVLSSRVISLLIKTVTCQTVSFDWRKCDLPVFLLPKQPL